jgi:hypothetical protein
MLAFEILEVGVVCLVVVVLLLLLFSWTTLVTPVSVVAENPTTRQRRFVWPMARRFVALTD